MNYYFSWSKDAECNLQLLVDSLSEIFKGTEYSAMRNPTKGERNVDIHHVSHTKRVAYIYPKPKFQLFDVCLRTETLKSLKNKMVLPEIEVIKDSMPGFSKVRVDYNTTVKIMMKLVGKEEI